MSKIRKAEGKETIEATLNLELKSNTCRTEVNFELDLFRKKNL